MGRPLVSLVAVWVTFEGTGEPRVSQLYYKLHENAHTSVPALLDCVRLAGAASTVRPEADGAVDFFFCLTEGGELRLPEGTMGAKLRVRVRRLWATTSNAYASGLQNKRGNISGRRGCKKAVKRLLGGAGD